MPGTSSAIVGYLSVTGRTYVRSNGAGGVVVTTFKVMATYPVQAGRDHLAQFTKKRPLDAVAELIWNALDAEATRASVKVAVASAAGEGAEHVTAVTITDNGHGFTHETACQAFATIGDSWKRSLGGLTVSGDRILHGSKGRGRFFAYSLGSRAEWTTVYDDSGTKQRLRVNGDADSIDQFEIEAPEQAKNRLVVELKRPSATVTEDHLSQVKRYARTLAQHDGIADGVCRR